MTWQPIETEHVLRQVLADLSEPPPSTKGMAPAERAQRLHAEMERRAARARYALNWKPAPTSDTDAFLSRMQASAETGEPVTAEDVARLRRLADWADAAPPVGWNGTLDRHETRRAIEAARKGARDE